MIQLLHEDDFFRVEHNAPERIFRLARTARALGEGPAAERAYAAVDRVLSGVPSGSMLFIDIREAPPREDPAFESTVKKVRDPILGRFARVAILTSTAAGKKQVTRMNQGLPATVAVFDDEDQAFDHLYA
jgi:hypothetical protein